MRSYFYFIGLLLMSSCQSQRFFQPESPVDILTVSHFHTILNELCFEDYRFIYAINQGGYSPWGDDCSDSGNDVCLWNIYQTPDTVHKGDFLFSIRLSSWNGKGFLCRLGDRDLSISVESMDKKRSRLYFDFLGKTESMYEKGSRLHFDFLGKTDENGDFLSTFLSTLSNRCENAQFTKSMPHARMVDTKTMSLFHSRLNKALSDNFGNEATSYIGYYDGILNHYGRSLLWIDKDEMLENVTRWDICKVDFFEPGKPSLLEPMYSLTISPYNGKSRFMEIDGMKINVDFGVENADKDDFLNLIFNKLKDD